jgi:hypothetical protein
MKGKMKTLLGMVNGSTSIQAMPPQLQPSPSGRHSFIYLKLEKKRERERDDA